MPNLEFAFDWEDAGGIKGPELASTWAALSVRVNDSVLTRVVDHADGRVRDRIHVPLYPLAEWLATNWWFLLNECEDPARESDPFFRHRRWLGPSREGYRFPNLQAASSDAFTRIAWKHDRLRWTGIEFLDREGEEWIGKDEFRQTCAGFVDKVVRRLSSGGITGTLLQEDWAAIRNADDEERMFCETAAGLGWDPYAIDDSQRASVVRVGEVLSGAVFEEAIPILNAETLEADIDAIVRVLEVGKTAALPLERLVSIRDAACRAFEAHDRPWKIGYSLARGVREQLNLDGRPLASWQELSQALGEARMEKGVMQSPAFDGAIRVDGVVTTDENGQPALAFRLGEDNTLRFLFCRGLAELLLAPSSDALLTRTHSNRQQQGRAFAAEFLAPADGLRARIQRNVLDEEDVGKLAADFGVSPLVIAHQVKNHGIAHVQYEVGDWPT